MAAAWLIVTGLTTGFFFAPRGMEAQPTLDDVFGFACSFAITGGITLSMGLGIGGRLRWAFEAAIALLVMTTTLVVLFDHFLFRDPSFARAHIGFWELQRIQSHAERWRVQIPAYQAPLGAGLGAVLGLVVGLLARLGGRLPRLATGIALLLLFASASGKQLAFDQLIRCGWMLRHKFVPWSIIDDQITVTGLFLGGAIGAVIAGLILYVSRRKATMLTRRGTGFKIARRPLGRFDSPYR